MSRRLKPLELLQDAQEAASDPAVHASLSASAGTGKTHVLTARVLRLLLRGVDPSTILCLTFTKAGAAEMANRIGGRLAAWVRLDDPALEKELFALGEARAKPDLARARQLFAKVLDAPGGLRIQTIHSFAQALLASFPAEAGVTPGFQPVEGRARDELARETLAGLLADAEAAGDRQLLDDVRTLSLRLGEGGAERYLLECAGAGTDITALGHAETFEHQLRTLMNVPEGDIDAHLAAACADSRFDCALLEQLVAANRAWGTATGDKICARLAAFLAAPPAERVGLLPSLLDGIRKKDGSGLAKISPKQLAADPDYEAVAQQLVDAVEALCRLQTAASLARVQAAGLRAGSRFADVFAAAKRTRGLADFDDLIRWTRELFDQPGMGEWVRFKLDRRTDHILVDEAQDTNADQWAIVGALSAEFLAGDGQDDRWRTLFMVGDYKQAIYGFQGTDPREFDKFRAATAERARALAVAARDDLEAFIRPFRDLSIDASFRSSPAVLEVVDSVLEMLGPDAMGLQRPAHRHEHAKDYAGQVELWPAYIGPPRPDGDEDSGEEGWVDEPIRLYADALAKAVQRMVDEAPVLASTGQPLGPGDVLILVRSRSELASLIVARLAARGVPVAGIDRLILSKPLAVRDLLSAIAFAVQPADDLNLAGLLVSPLIGWSQQQLYEIAFGRRVSLWSAIERRREEPGIGGAHAVLAQILSMADRVAPSRFLEIILSGELDGRRKLMARLGAAARDPIEELVTSALDYERTENPSLDRFLSWFGRGEVEIKRDPSAPAAAVRVMTVHGSKGLEAPVVILADATYDPARSGGPRSTFSHKLSGEREVPLVRPRSDERVPPFDVMLDAQKALDLEEHWRLLYVALTRARERLIVAGPLGRHERKDDSWHALVERAMRELGGGSIEGPWGEALAWSAGGRAGRVRTRKSRPQGLVESAPAWVKRPAPEEERPPRPLAPSSIADDQEVRPPPTDAMRKAARRGSLLHGLFERVPGVAPSDRHRLAVAWLERQGLDSEEADVLATSACGLIGDPAYTDLFGSASLAEAPIAATLPDGRVIAGTVDRLLITEERVRVIDFKTGSRVPFDMTEVPDHHRAQMAAYTAALRVIFPDRPVEAALLYTHGPKYIALPG